MATIAITHSGLAGHLLPAARLGSALASEGHRVLAWAPAEHRQLIEGTGAEFQLHEPVRARYIMGGIGGFAAILAEATERCVGELIEQLFAHRVDLVIHDCHAPWGRVAADFLGVPRIVSNPLFPVPSEVFPPLESITCVPRGSDEDFERAHAGRLTIARRWGIDVGDWPEAMVSAGRLTIAYTTPEIAGDGPLRPGWRFVGPLMGLGPRARRADQPRPVVYAAFGTFFNVRVEMFRAVIEALADAPLEVIVSTGRSLLPPASLGPLPSNVTVHQYVDSREVLARASVHVTHGGCSSVHESLLAGVPMVCLPQGSDQVAWAKRIETLGAGEIVAPAPEAIWAAVRRMLEDGRPSERASELGGHLAGYDGAGQVSATVEHALGAANVSV